MMQTIVSIDFDIIMAPSINLYNNIVPAISWANLEDDPYFQLLKIDATHYQKILGYIMKCIKVLPKDKIHFIEDHSQAVCFINDKCNLINIDHHHDIGYGPDILTQESPTCANWVYYLYKNNYINTYTWINNDNSIAPEDNNQLVPIITHGLRNFDLMEFEVPEELIICLSEPWTPPYIRPLFYTIMDICNKYYDTHFDILMGPYLQNHEGGTKHT